MIAKSGKGNKTMLEEVCSLCGAHSKISMQRFNWNPHPNPQPNPIMFKSKFNNFIFNVDEDHTVVQFVFVTPNIQEESIDNIKKIKNDEVRKIIGYKSFLSKMSPVFEKMFSENWNQSEFVMDDQVDFNQLEVFQLFMELVCGLANVDTLTINQIICVHFYAHKYLMDPLIAKILEVLTNRTKSEETFSVTEFIDSIKMAELYSLNEFKKQLNKVKLDITSQSDAIKAYNICIDCNMNQNVIRQVVSYMESQPVNDWPINLVIRVLESNQTKLMITKSSLENVERKLKEFQNKTLYCCHTVEFKLCSYCRGSRLY